MVKLDVRDQQPGVHLSPFSEPFVKCPTCNRTALDVGESRSDRDGRMQRTYVHVVTLSAGGNFGGAHYTDVCVVRAGAGTTISG